MAYTEPVELSPELRRRNAKLGLALGFVVIVIMVAFMVGFTVYGLPQDPKEYARIKQEESAAQAESDEGDGLGASTKDSMVAPAPTATDGESR
jgi:hypothetical protein